MRSLAADIRIAGFVGAVMAAWLTVFLIVGTIGALYGAPQSHSPLLFTLLITSIASSTVSVVTASLEGSRGTAETADNRSVATFVFVNAAGTMVGLVTNLSESLERWEPAGPNGLTFIYQQIAAEQMPLLLYAAIVGAMTISAAYLVVRGSRLVSAKVRPSEEDLQVLGGLSGSLLALWIFTCMRWQPLSWGAETVATTWTVIVYAGLLLFATWLYGFAGIRAIIFLSRAFFQLARSATDLLLDPRTWRLVLLVLLAIVGLTGIAALVYLVATAVVAGASTAVEFATPEETERLLRSYTVAVGSTLRILSVAGLCCVSIAAIFLLPRLLRAGRFIVVGTASKLASTASSIQILRPGINVRDLQLMQLASWIGRVISSRLIAVLAVTSALVSVARSIRVPRFPLGTRASWFIWSFRRVWNGLTTGIVRHRALIARAVITSFPLFVLLTASTNYNLERDRPGDAVIILTTPSLPIQPLVSALQPTPISVSFEPIGLCDVRVGAAEWAYESDNQVSVGLDGCRVQNEIGADEALLVVAMSTLGNITSTEEARSFRRMKHLMSWAGRNLTSETRLYGLDLGMATNSNSHIALSRVFGVSWSERPLIGMIVRSSEDPVESDLLVAALAKHLAENLVLGSSYSKCALYESDTFDRVALIMNC